MACNSVCRLYEKRQYDGIDRILGNNQFGCEDIGNNQATLQSAAHLLVVGVGVIEARPRGVVVRGGRR